MHPLATCLTTLAFIATVGAYGVNEVWNGPYIPWNYRQVTRKEQLWRFLVGEGLTEITAGDKYLCLKTNQGKFLHNCHDRGIENTADACGADERWEPILWGGNRWVLKGSNEERALGCWGGKAIGYRTTYWPPYKPQEKVDWPAQKLWINPEEDTLVIQGHRDGGFVTTRYSPPHVDCQNTWKQNTFLKGWKMGPKDEWRAKDGEVVVIDCDNTDPRSKYSIRCSYSRTVGQHKSASRTRTVSTSVSVSVEKGFALSFQASIRSSIGFNWSTTSSETFSRSQTSSAEIEVRPGYRMQVLQVVGTLGPFEFRTPIFKTRVVVAPRGIHTDAGAFSNSIA